MTQPRELIRLESAAVRYRLRRKIAGSRDYWALHDVTFSVHEGDALGILGSNGAGKSTLLKLMAGLIAPDRGSAWIARGVRVSLLALGVGFESNLTGRENARLSALLLGKDVRQLDECISRVEEFAELGEFFDQPVYTYSSGMVMRLGFSVALEVDPDVLLIDEVLAVGDAAFLEKSFTALQARFMARKTVVLITHDLPMIQKLCSRAVWIDHGTLKASGDTATIAEAYAGG
ncbi:MAG: ABC transporter ATP-binding protein [Verrucomicrobia bacterium]|nr:ABC transporter ATP-binding protein [Verrucomicrobiota bacterium]